MIQLHLIRSYLTFLGLKEVNLDQFWCSQHLAIPRYIVIIIVFCKLAILFQTFDTFLHFVLFFGNRIIFCVPLTRIDVALRVLYQIRL